LEHVYDKVSGQWCQENAVSVMPCGYQDTSFFSPFNNRGIVMGTRSKTDTCLNKFQLIDSGNNSSSIIEKPEHLSGPYGSIESFLFDSGTENNLSRFPLNEVDAPSMDKPPDRVLQEHRSLKSKNMALDWANLREGVCRF